MPIIYGEHPFFSFYWLLECGTSLIFFVLAAPAGLHYCGRAQKGDPGGQADRPQAHHGGSALGEERR